MSAGAGIGYYQQTVPSFDINYANLANGANINADLKLRIVPFNATFRFLPLGRHHYGVEPYIGGGIGVFGWRYSESGQFVDPAQPRFAPSATLFHSKAPSDPRAGGTGGTAPRDQDGV